jgi:DNA-binding response OmpR family regulator
VRARLHVLVVDDDARFRRTLRLALDTFGYEVSDAADGEEATETIGVSAPDLIVLDWQLPGMDGVQTCRALKSRWDAPIVMMSGSRSNLREAALAAGASDYLAKPFSLSELLGSMEAALKTRKLQRGT